MKALMWFRRDLRTLDNTALIQSMMAVNEKTNSGHESAGLMALFIMTPEQWKLHGMSTMQRDLICRRLQALSQELHSLNIQLHIETVDTFEQCPELIKERCEQFNIDHVFANQEYEINEVTRDHQVQKLLEGMDVGFSLHMDKCIFAPGSVKNKQGSYFKVFTPFKKCWLSRFTQHPILVRKPQRLATNALFDSNTVVDWQALMPFASDQFSPEQSSLEHTFSGQSTWLSDTSSIIALLREFVAQKSSSYHQDRDFPALDGTSTLSPYLALGMLSVRQCIARLLCGRRIDQLNEGEQTWLSELIWREFYQHLIHFEPKLCMGKTFVPWADNLEWLGSDTHLKKWQQGETGYPIVDAAMQQLNQTGWMHNRLRMVVASFLSKDLLIDWRKGEAYFMSKLVDGDFAANNGGWQWSASVGCDAQPYFRIFNPISQGQRFDPDGEFVKRWLPQLKSVPSKFIHSPWLWDDFQSLDYPQPIVDHKQQRLKALQMYKEAKDSGS
ncbi:deoxyribodipyrimidine photo-lyase [Vibrio sp. UCD-FRSSP16_10]|uniref:deoxyribodipyrimidine photo-lyase n=1 Tax=unclassified Vibrio TaxID=2614977 RepID=UPI0007FF7C23|nr:MULTISPECIES: deoxyribodipyrimidine photo-lyase [unclassified Vibrio]OBT09480.1 deoxyribodipyrimidine photo-lyase [Vibrio sp. UCD-FRSSP16_30]OBT19522.1 deoxyribodipyrimidine photo-lyase [Vibrio sp. UCD-FRSSP16_10]